MDKTYTRINWVNESVSQTTPLGATNLNTIDYAVDAIDDRVITLDTTKALESDVLTMLADVSYDATSGTFTFSRKNGSTIIADLNIEKIPVSFSMDENGVITMTTSDGSTYTADVGSLIKTYTFNDSSDIDFTTTTDESGNKNVTASIVDGSVTRAKMNPDYLAEIEASVNSASASATSASTSAGTATTASTNASASATASESWAIGGTGTRSGEDTNNAKYWCEQAESKSGIGTGVLTIKQNGETAGTFNANSSEDVEIDLVGSSGGGTWGSITGTLSDQADLNDALETKADASTTYTKTEIDDKETLIRNDLSRSYTEAEWEALDHSSIKDGAQIVISDDYDSNICSTVAECEASTSADDVCGASALAELAPKGDIVTILEKTTTLPTTINLGTALDDYRAIVLSGVDIYGNIANSMYLTLALKDNIGTYLITNIFSDRYCAYGLTNITTLTYLSGNNASSLAVYGIK